MLVAVLLAGLIVAAPALQRDGIHEVALPSRQNSRATGEIDGPALLSAINNTLSKYCGGSLDLGLPGVKPLQRRQSTIGLVDQVEDTDIDDIYYGSITVGTHGPQLFTVQFDTGKSEPVSRAVQI
ncbi:hypothetical protein MMC28_005545 [Mycoblastus sanguinarius]|nr:hypothetical protein [Mycoblastus sanguinarius]